MAARDVAGRRYALAVLDLARERGALDHWVEAIDGLDGLTAQPQYVSALQRDGLTDAQFQSIVRQVVPGIDVVEMNLFRLLRRKKRLVLGPSIASFFRELRDEELGIVRATVRTAVPLDEAQRARITDQLSRAAGGGRVELESEVDPALIAGVVIRVGDRLIDGSTRTRLRRLRRVLVEGMAS